MSVQADISAIVRKDVELAGYTTFGVPAKARYFAVPSSVEELRALYSDETFASFPKMILGGGSNVLFTKDFDGLVIKLGFKGIELVDENDGYRFYKVAAGCDWTETVGHFVAEGIWGLENLSLIPGTVGGAVVQNIGAYGIEIAERLLEVECFDPASGEMVTLNVNDCDYGYRTSVFKTDKKDLVVVSATLALPIEQDLRIGYKELKNLFGERSDVTPQEVADAVIQIRRKKLPDPKVIGSAGSFFKNPVVSRIKMRALLEDMPQLVAYPLAGGRAKLAAGWLIDAVGFKGKRRGDAGVYEKQALVLVNHGNATGAEIKALADEVARAVWLRFGVNLEPEPVII